MTTDADSFYIPRAEQKLLLALLRRIPALAEDLAITETKRARTQRTDTLGFRKRRKMNSSLPLNDDAFIHAEVLRNELFGWVRVVCEQRSHAVEDVNSLIAAAGWLAKNIIPLAMTEGAKDAYPGIYSAMKGCEKVIDLPPDDYISIDFDKVEKANKQIVTAGQVEKIAGKLGDVGKGLTRRRVRYLHTVKALEAIDQGDDGTNFYRLGDVLHAHVTHRNKRGSVA